MSRPHRWDRRRPLWHRPSTISKKDPTGREIALTAEEAATFAQDEIAERRAMWRSQEHRAAENIARLLAIPDDKLLSKTRSNQNVKCQGRVRICELAREVGVPSDQLIALFYDRLDGLYMPENASARVPDPIADLVRSVLLV